MRYAHPGSEGAIVSFKARYGNYIGGEFVPPVKGQHFTNTSPVNGQPIAEFPRSTAEDIDKALDAAHAGRHPPGRRPLPLLRRLHPRPGRLRCRDQRQHRGLPHP